MGELSLPMTDSFGMSFEALHVTDARKEIVGLLEISFDLEMEGKTPVRVGGSRYAAFWLPGRPKFSGTKKFERTWYTNHIRARRGYMDLIENLTYSWITRAREHRLEFYGFSLTSEKGSAAKTHDSALEIELPWECLRVNQFVDNVEIPFLVEGTL